MLDLPLARLILCCVLLLTSCTPKPDPHPPVVWIVVDTLRADRLEGPHARRTTPELAGWIPRGRRFENAFATSPWTLPSFASLYTGLIPSRHGAGIHDDPDARFTRLRDEVPTLAERLREAGYETGAIIGNAALSPEFGMARGFDSYDYAPATNAFTRRADVVVDRALTWLARRETKAYFLVVHLFDPHMNYDAPPPFRGRFTAKLGGGSLPVQRARQLRNDPGAVAPAGRRFIEAAYDEEVAFIDQQVGRLLLGLAELGLLDEGLIVLTSDHGEELFDHGGFEHGHALWQEVVQPPLVVWGRDVVPGRDETPVSLVDLAPTVAAFTGLAAAGGSDGRSLWPRLRDEGSLPERDLLVEAPLYGKRQQAAIRWPHKLIWSSETGSEALYDLSLDPDEARPLVLPDTASALRGRAEGRGGSGDSNPVVLDPETLQALRDLGYAEPGDD